ncbi:MAG: DUF2335 domain-containing protein, partial [Proteobacteria bacterium]|nr:DUF2335 domain-containing protein [Pseudomonadota bacterium]
KKHPATIKKTNHQITQTAFYHRSAPLPTPQELEHYNQIIPNAAERIFSVFENQNKHRQELELRVIKNDCRNSLFGMIFGFIIGMTGMIGGIYLTVLNHGGWGLSVTGACLCSLVGIFVYGTERRKKEREEKARAAMG